MPTQAEKYAVAMAGEHYVAAELLRRGLAASVTMGNAKRADVVVMNPSATKVVVIEVKSSSRREWIVGSLPPEPSEQPWVFVRVPSDPIEPPEYFIFKARELHEILWPLHEAYCTRFQDKHGKPFEGKGVMSLKLADAQPGKNCWSKIVTQVV